MSTWRTLTVRRQWQLISGMCFLGHQKQQLNMRKQGKQNTDNKNIAEKYNPQCYAEMRFCHIFTPFPIYSEILLWVLQVQIATSKKRWGLCKSIETYRNPCSVYEFLSISLVHTALLPKILLLDVWRICGFHIEVSGFQYTGERQRLIVVFGSQSTPATAIYMTASDNMKMHKHPEIKADVNTIITDKIVAINCFIYSVF